MHSASWLIALFALTLAFYGSVCAYRLTSTTVGDAMFLMLLTAAAMGAGYLFW
jgi:hypothetical protein